MKPYVFKISAMAASLFLLYGTSYPQDQNINKDKKVKAGSTEEIIIKRKGDKDAKITVETRDGQILINGKPADEFKDDNFTVRKFSETWVDDGDVISITPHSPFRGGAWSNDGDGDFLYSESRAAFLGVSSEKAPNSGAAIEEVTTGSAAEKAGLKKGDIITKVDDMKIDDPEDLTKAIHKYKPEDKVVVTFTRDGKEQKATAVLGKTSNANFYAYNFKMPRINPDMNINAPHVLAWSSPSPRLGIKAQDTEDGKGVKVLDVDDESPADKAGVKEGDIITLFDGKEVTGAMQLAELARASKGKTSYKIKVTRAGKPQELEVRIPKKLKTADL
jgi:serine protease Do